MVGESMSLGIRNLHQGSLEEEVMVKAIGRDGGEPSWGGKCPHKTVEVIDLQCDAKSSNEE